MWENLIANAAIKVSIGFTKVINMIIEFPKDFLNWSATKTSQISFYFNGRLISKSYGTEQKECIHYSEFIAVKMSVRINCFISVAPLESIGNN